MLWSLFFAVLITAGSASAQLSTQLSTTDGVTTVTFSTSAAQKNAFSGAPYSARQTFNSVQTLPGGTHLTQKPIVTSIWQDFAGRKRTEQETGAWGATTGNVTQIVDPVESVIYVLDPAASIAHRVKLSAILTHVNPARPAPATGPPSIKTQANGSVFTIEELGTQVIGGFNAYGTRMTTRFPAGSSLGNDQPVDSISEMWYAPQLGTTILSKRSDPRSGDSTMTLGNIVPGEPDASLLRPPAGYRVVDETGPFSVKLP